MSGPETHEFDKCDINLVYLQIAYPVQHSGTLFGYEGGAQAGSPSFCEPAAFCRSTAAGDRRVHCNTGQGVDDGSGVLIMVEHVDAIIERELQIRIVDSHSVLGATANAFRHSDESSAVSDLMAPRVRDLDGIARRLVHRTVLAQRRP